jgi:hypothetical protein
MFASTPMTRYLQIAAAVTFALLAWAFIGLWVRSYYLGDTAEGLIANWRTGFHSTRGVVIFGVVNGDKYPLPDDWSVNSFPIAQDLRWKKRTTLGFAIDRHVSDGWWYLYLPHWFLAASSFTLAALFAFKRTWRFTTRGLLIATTLLAVALGLGVYFI